MEIPNQKSIKTMISGNGDNHNEDLVALGVFFAINSYVMMVITNLIEGIDGYLKSLPSLQTIVIILCIIIFQSLIEVYVRYINRNKYIYLISKLILGSFIAFIAYMLAVTTGSTNGYDNRIRTMTNWDYQNLLTIEFMYFCIVLAYIKVKKRKISNAKE